VCRLSEFDEKLLDSQRRDSATNELLARHESEIEARHVTIRRLESELGRVNGELDRVNNELGQVMEERQRLADELKQRHEEATESELTRLRMELGQVREDRSRLTSDADRTRRQLIDSEGRTQRATQELNRVRSELIRVTGELNDLDRRTNGNQLQQQELAQAKQCSDDLCNALSTDLENLKVKLADTVGELATTKRSNEELKNRLAA